MKRLLIILVAVLGGLGLSYADELDTILAAERDSQTATAISIIFDTSGSMLDDNKLNEAKSAFSKWIDELPDSYSLGLTWFVAGQGQSAVPLAAGVRDEVAEAVANARAGGKTPIAQCLEIVGADIEKRRTEFSPYERHVVVVFTDGMETVNRRGNRQVVDEIEKLRSKMVEVVGIGFHGQGKYMAEAATKYFDAKNEAELVAGLSEVDAEIGTDADIEITRRDLVYMGKAKIENPPAPIPESK